MDERGIAAFLLIALGFLCWQYAHYAETIQKTIFSVLATLSCFFLSAAFVSLLKGLYTGKDWWVALGLPAVSLGVCIVTFFKAVESYDPVLTELSYKYPVIQFYTQGLSKYGVTFLVTHVAGLTIIGLIAIISSFSLLNYLALMNQRQQGYAQGIWIFFVRISFWATGVKGLLLMVLLNVMAYILIAGHFTNWIT